MKTEKSRGLSSQPEDRALRLTKLGVIEKLIEFGPTSRSELAGHLNLSRPAITALSRELIELGLIRESEVQHSGHRQGRPSILLALNPDYGYFLGVCITDDPPVLTLCDIHGNVAAEHEIAFTSEPEAVATAIQQGIHSLLAARRSLKGSILGIGIVVSGLVNHKEGICLLSNELNWRNVPVAKIVQEATGIPAFLENDANAAATGEKLFGNARTAKDFAVITVDACIGSALYIHNQLYSGHIGGAGEIGHITADPNGIPCRCGKKGCVDTISGRKAILETARIKGLTAQNLSELEFMAAAGNAEAISILYRAGRALGLATAHLIMCNNPRTVIFTLPENIIGGVFTAATSQTIESNILPQFIPSTEILFYHMHKNFWARGAASIAAHEYFRYQASI